MSSKKNHMLGASLLFKNCLIRQMHEKKKKKGTIDSWLPFLLLSLDAFLKSTTHNEEKKQLTPGDTRSANVTALALLGGSKLPLVIWLSVIASSHCCIGVFIYLFICLTSYSIKVNKTN